MLKEISIALISSACVGLTTIAGTVWINTDNIEDLKDDLSDLTHKLDRQTNEIHRLELKIAGLNGRISRESAERLSSLNDEEINQLESELQSTNFQSDSEIKNSSSEELISNPNLSPELRSIVKSHELTGTDLQNFQSLESAP